MRILSRFLGVGPVGSRARRRRLSADRHRSPMGLEPLEGRELMSLAGVSVTYGNLLIKAPLASHNTAQVSIDSSNQYVKVTLNGSSEEFNPSSVPVYNITYVGASGGGDTFTDSTSLPSLDSGYGGNNTFTGGSGYNYVYFWGNDNTYNGQSSIMSDVWENYGSGDTINSKGGNVNIYSN